MRFNGFSLVHLLKNNRKITQSLLTEIGSEISLEEIQKIVCYWYNLPNVAFFSKIRNREIVVPRQVYCYLSKIMTSKTLAEIGDPIGYDHATVIHSIKTIKRLLTNKQFLTDISLVPEIYMDIEHRFKHKIIRRNKIY